VSSATLELCKPLISLCAAHKRVAPLTSKTGQRDNALQGVASSRRQASSQRFCSALWPCGSSTWPAQILPTLRALILNLSAVLQGRVSFLATESQINCKMKHLKTLNQASKD